jgi:translocation and assembly module TamB
MNFRQLRRKGVVIAVLRKSCIIDKGVVTFTGSEDINPILDVSASYKISDYIIYVDVVGKSKKPDINYRSEPELDQGDILSLLVFGKTSDRLTGRPKI